ncbi:MAG: N-acetylmuramoyl-L-alanine amidase [Pseudolabrys sp.]|jgi:hypothetical protein
MFRRLLLLLALIAPAGAWAAPLPPIIANADNSVPKCVQPAALMNFVQRINTRRHMSIAPRFDHIATLYKNIGSCVSRPPDKCIGVRWDFAFFQMLIETNYLTFRRPGGGPAGVPAKDNNFAGLGATVPGRPGERFGDVHTGVLAHLQHVLMYSTTPVPHPVAKRTRLVQSDVQDIMKRLHRPVTFADLAREWTGVDQSGYARDMRLIAAKFDRLYCENQKTAQR